MKHFDKIVIEEQSGYNLELYIEPSVNESVADVDDVIDLVVCEYGEEQDRIGITHAAAISLRDALNAILND